jgi:hypothetical protein
VEDFSFSTPFVAKFEMRLKGVFLFNCYLGIPNALNVISNFPFMVIGLIGLMLCHRRNYFNFRYFHFLASFIQSIFFLILLLLEKGPF